MCTKQEVKVYCQLKCVKYNKSIGLTKKQCLWRAGICAHVCSGLFKNNFFFFFFFCCIINEALHILEFCITCNCNTLAYVCFTVVIQWFVWQHHEAVWSGGTQVKNGEILHQSELLLCNKLVTG